MSDASRLLDELYLMPPSPSETTDFILKRVDSIIRHEIEQDDYPDFFDDFGENFGAYDGNDQDEWYNDDDDDELDDFADDMDGQNYLPFDDLEEKSKKGGFHKKNGKKCMCPECRYQRGEISRKEYEKLMEKMPIPEALPKDLQNIMNELARKVGTINPTRKQMDALMDRNPLFVAKLIAILGKYGGGSFGDLTGIGK
jgi:hypothetical protein